MDFLLDKMTSRDFTVSALVRIVIRCARQSQQDNPLHTQFFTTKIVPHTDGLRSCILR